MQDYTELKVPKIKRQTLNRHVYEAIKKSILDGSIPPDAKLSEVSMGRQLGVSATPVREAFRMLSMEGLVRIDPWKGAVVIGFSERAALETMQCREALELLALTLSIENLKPHQLKAIRHMIEDARVTEDISEFVRISSAIHDIWVEGCGNSRLTALIGQLNDILLRERNVSANNNQRKLEIIEEHEQILTAMEKRDVPGATEALRRHIHNGYEYSLLHEHTQ